MEKTNSIPEPVFLPVLEETAEKEDLLLNHLESRQYEYECIQRARSLYGMV